MSINRDPTDLYNLLGVDRSATVDEIRSAYANRRAEAMMGDNPGEEGWERIRYAYEVLSSPDRRSLYDSLVAETTGPAVSLDVVLSTTRLTLLDSPQLFYALVNITSSEGRDAQTQPLNLAMVIDRSTSMRGERLDTVIQAVDLLLDKLGPEDVLSVVSFSDRAEIILPAHRRSSTGTTDPQITDAWRDPHKRLRSITASGGTEIYQGLRAGLDQARRLAAGRTSHLVLLTDGHTYGDAPDCLHLAEEAAAEGIDITALGIGADWNDHFLDALVAPSGGQSGFIEQPGDLLPVLEKRLRGLEAAYGRHVMLLQNWPSQLTLRAGFKLSPFSQPLAHETNAIPLGNLEGRATLSFLLEFLVAPQAIPTRVRLPIEIQYRLSPDSGQVQTLDQTIQLVVNRGEESGQPPAALLEAAHRCNLYRMQEQAWEEAQSGQLETAAAKMRRLASRYLETGDLRLAQQAQLESQHLAHVGAMSPEGRKVLKYGTRSLMGILDS